MGGDGSGAAGVVQDPGLPVTQQTADPVHLIRVFGISDTTALKYVHAAHPGRQPVIPR